MCFSPSAVVSPALPSFLYRQWNKRNYSTPFLKCFSLFWREKKSLRKTFLLECVRSGAQQPTRKGGNFGAKLTHLCGFWLDVSIFLQVKKTSFVILIGRIIFFLRVKTIVHSSDWLELICVSKFTTQLFGECLSVCIIYRLSHS